MWRGSVVDGVKVDGQAAVGGDGPRPGGGPALAKKLHEMLERSLRTHFPDEPGSSRCMCPEGEHRSVSPSPTWRASATTSTPRTAPATPYTSPTSRTTLSSWARSSRRTGTCSSRTALEAAALHAAARASACPCTRSDAAAATTSRYCASGCFLLGRCCARRCPGVRRATAADPCADGATALKIWNRNEPTTGAASSAMFNVQAAWGAAKGVSSLRASGGHRVAETSARGDVETLPTTRSRRPVVPERPEPDPEPRTERGAENGRSENGGSFPLGARCTRTAACARRLGLRDGVARRLGGRSEVYAVAETRRASFDVS